MTTSEPRPSSLYGWMHSHFLTERFSEMCRVALSAGFMAPGLTKVLGLPFTTLGLDEPVGFFFEALYRAQPYWQFLGWCQVLASILVLVPRLQYLGALLFFVILLNVFLITLSIPFGLTPVITGLMFLASLYLVIWDYPRLASMHPAWKGDSVTLLNAPVISRLERSGYLLTTLAGWIETCFMRGLVARFIAVDHDHVFSLSLALGLFGLLLLLISWLNLWKQQRSIELGR